MPSAYVVERVQRRAGAKWLQGRWPTPLWSEASEASDAMRESGAQSPLDAVRLVAEHRLHRVERVVAEALVAWADGRRRVALLTHVPAPRDVLAYQARGWRCVSLLADDDAAKPHDDGLAFCLHDLCHLEKFAHPEHHLAQVGFFALLERAMQGPAWALLEADFDEAWATDRDHVAGDMNGSPVFLFAALKMKLKMAVRRRVARQRGAPPPTGGPLDTGEAVAFAIAVDAMLDALSVDGDARGAALDVSTRRDTPESALCLVTRFEEEGARAASKVSEARSPASPAASTPTPQ
jgi:hypothetical protein